MEFLIVTLSYKAFKIDAVWRKIYNLILVLIHEVIIEKSIND